MTDVLLARAGRSRWPVAAGASLIGAFAAGWLTPERQPPLPNSTAQQLLGLAEPPR